MVQSWYLRTRSEIRDKNSDNNLRYKFGTIQIRYPIALLIGYSFLLLSKTRSHCNLRVSKEIAQQKVERLAAKLREFNIDPDSI